MSVIVKGIDKRPISCFKCPLMTGSDECILLSSDENFIYDDVDLAQTSLCPIIGELPEKHGRLIDADAFINYLNTEMSVKINADKETAEILKQVIVAMYEKIIEAIQEQKTVIESEE